jgi:hypothetical protein
VYLNYSGISILPAMPKLIELLVFDSLFFDTKSSIAVVQHGFLKNRSTVVSSFEFNGVIFFVYQGDGGRYSNGCSL